MEETIEQFIGRMGIRSEVYRAHENPNADGFSKDASHWSVKLIRNQKATYTSGGDAIELAGERQLSVFFSQGSAHREQPTAAEVLDCLASDSTDAFETFENWCAEYGYDDDSRKAEKTYAIVQKQAANLKRFLGANEYRNLLENVGRM